MMDSVIRNQESNATDISVLDNNNQEVYTGIINHTSYSTLPKHEIVYTPEKQNSVLSNDDYQSALKCLDEFEKRLQPCQKMNYYFNGNEEFSHAMDKVNDTKNAGESEHTSFKTTDDESMAVEALRQLGGMYPSVVTTEETLPMLPCNLCNMKFHTTSDLRAHMITCGSQIYQNYRCAVCSVMFINELSYNNHKCKISRLPCKYCYIYFTTRNELENHIDVKHNEERPYKCHICDVTFQRSSSLANHVKIHSNYQPDPPLLTKIKNVKNMQKVTVPNPLNISNWAFENVYVPENTVNNTSTDSLTNWNLDYVSNPLIQAETNKNLVTIGQELSGTNDFPQQSVNENILEKNSNKKVNDNIDFQVPIKIELYTSELENLDESFPITSMPQMEVTVGNDSKKPHICSNCGMSFSREKALLSHLKLHVIGWTLSHECENCGKTFPDENSISEHKQCCGIVLNQTFEQNIQAENKTIDPSKKIVKNLAKPQVKVGKHRCSECDKQFTTKQKMFRHLWIHRKKTFTCEMCASTFEVQLELDKHRLSQHPPDSPYVCNECGKCFASRQGLWEHGRVHGGGTAGLFTCDKCNKTFASRQGFLIHNRTHTDERPYGCRFCLKAFRDGGTLRKHERIHTGCRPYVCPICFHDFNQKVVLREHVRWVHVRHKAENEDGMFPCQLCTLNISDREELCAHIVKHSDLLTLEAKNNMQKQNQNHPKVNKRVKKKIAQSKNNIVNVDIVPSEEIVIPKKEQLDLSLEYNLSQFDLDQKNVECDLCGIKLSSQKDLMTHVRIHI